MNSSINIPSNSIPVLNIDITEHSSNINEASSNRLFILLIKKDNRYSCILASVIYSYSLYSSVSFDQGFAANIITKDKQEEFAA
jgi:hypothetical protein